jgi:hypothetical protein
MTIFASWRPPRPDQTSEEGRATDNNLSTEATEPRPWWNCPSLLTPAWLLAGVIGCAAAALVAVRFDLPWPQCPFRRLTGLPCPSCGCTRSLLAWFNWDLKAALQFNPLFFLGCVMAPLWLSAALLGKSLRWQWPERVRQSAAQWPLWQLFLLLLALNWLYLCLNLPT